jgi:hypothetical protein
METTRLTRSTVSSKEKIPIPISTFMKSEKENNQEKLPRK